jgi:hypothetical protein
VKLSIRPNFFVVLTSFVALVSAESFAVYPIAQNTYQQYQQPQYQQQQYQQYQPQQQYQAVQQNTYIPTNQVARYPQAASTNRITGSLPKVGSAYSNAARQYYQPENYDRLADSGLYIGLGLGYTYSISGGMEAEYKNETNAWYVPGAFKEATFKQSTVLPLQVSVGASINNDVRVDFSYLRYSGIGYSDTVQTSDGSGGYFGVKASDGRISSTSTMLNLYYNLDSYTGLLASGSLRPYVGVGLGISTNTISDYLIYDGSFYPEPDVYEGQSYPAGTLTAISDIYAYHAGGTTEQLAYAFEGGLTTEMEGGLKLDFFVRWANLGKVQSSGSIVVSQTEWLATGVGTIGQDGSEQAADYDSVFHYTDWKEGGNLNAFDMGIRMRIQF